MLNKAPSSWVIYFIGFNVGTFGFSILLIYLFSHMNLLVLSHGNMFISLIEALSYAAWLPALYSLFGVFLLIKTTSKKPPTWFAFAVYFGNACAAGFLAFVLAYLAHTGLGKACVDQCLSTALLNGSFTLILYVLFPFILAIKCFKKGDKKVDL